MQPLDDAPQLIERIERITAQALTEQLASGEPPVLIDVRSEGEWRERHVEQAVRKGELSGAQAAAVAEGSAADPSAQEQLLNRAKNDSLAGLREEAERVGLTFRRIDSLNVTPKFVEALATVVEETAQLESGG